MNTDFKINEELIEKTKAAVREIEEMQKEVLTKAANQRERALVSALYYNHDFVDERVKQNGRVEYIGWDEGHEPKYDFLDMYNERFDLRGVTYRDIREMNL